MFVLSWDRTATHGRVSPFGYRRPPTLRMGHVVYCFQVKQVTAFSIEAGDLGTVRD
jgi:hypothetical protein